MHNILKGVLIILTFVLIVKIYMIVANSVGKQIVEFFKDLWQRIGKNK
ncbi:MAG: hypothetical protein JG777_2673 [Clostridia bacterium]|jgi:hypothetical protein|nr:hypothetical protein [Petroclostridium xylanilyticum]MBZ4647184.1 hypothetical protein [Clostridia bacterium]